MHLINAVIGLLCPDTELSLLTTLDVSQSTQSNTITVLNSLLIDFLLLLARVECLDLFNNGAGYENVFLSEFRMFPGLF